jgi:hypothetical protein
LQQVCFKPLNAGGTTIFIHLKRFIMKHLHLAGACIALALSFFFPSCRQENTSASTAPQHMQSVSGQVIDGQYLIFFKPEKIPAANTYLKDREKTDRSAKSAAMSRYNALVAEQIQDWFQKQGIHPGRLLYLYTALQAGAAVALNQVEYERLLHHPDLERFEADRVENLPTFEVESVDDPAAAQDRAQTVPCGITNAGGYAQAEAARWIWIVDTGIDLDHPDLTVVTDPTYAKSYVGGTPDDCNGHGTHVAGSAAAVNNSIGVVGVAAGAPVVPIRVLGCDGSGTTSSILAGLNQVGSNNVPGDVVNLSLGGYYGGACAGGSPYIPVLYALTADGARIAIAAGNNLSSATLYQPACVNGTNIFTVANMRCNKTFYNASSGGSNYGRPPIDWIATGTSVYSTYKNGGYATLTGTSMAAPHVSGILHIRNNAPLSAGNVLYNGVSYPIASR